MKLKAAHLRVDNTGGVPRAVIVFPSLIESVTYYSKVQAIRGLEEHVGHLSDEEILRISEEIANSPLPETCASDLPNWDAVVRFIVLKIMAERTSHDQKIMKSFLN